jgi:ketosteroid isomerase-like protein
MNTPLEIVREFLLRTNDRGDVSGAVELMADDIAFRGPVVQIDGRDAYRGLLEQFLGAHGGWTLHHAFENHDWVCVIDDVFVRTPSGEITTLNLAELFQVREGKIAEHRVFYDPREFIKAFGQSLTAPEPTRSP